MDEQELLLELDRVPGSLAGWLGLRLLGTTGVAWASSGDRGRSRPLATGRQSSQPLIGRTREVAELELALDRVASGSPWCVELVGEPGIGKARLLAEPIRT